jgi:hypothetical protein
MMQVDRIGDFPRRLVLLARSSLLPGKETDESALENLAPGKPLTIAMPSNAQLLVQSSRHKGVVSQVHKFIEQSPRVDKPEPPICNLSRFHLSGPRCWSSPVPRHK